MAFRTGYNPKIANDLAAVNAAQDGIELDQACEGDPSGLVHWDPESLQEVGGLLNQASIHLGDNSKRMGSDWSEVNRIQHMVGAASSWGLLPPSTAQYFITYPEKNDGKNAYTLTFEAPELKYDKGGFWSITLYNSDGFIEPNQLGSYSFNSKSAKANADGSYTIHFGGDEKAANFLPIENMEGWNYSMRLYLPDEAILQNSYDFPVPQLVQ